ncbi:PREDICTED: E3 ubiquitin-protein ligase TRIM33-like [Polistes dominula]|uniref:E3 ubiquitin-protein ligase TRIM33-like n=1 Tax=Polistes dominula TaxID=743375 RepID=A0ABM1I1L2_POLDO|nr:PREDICTED: E3 ubiquitin-protein ligase TRIM33-like [Polistes dominula]XP_015174100.1 PREDICTED: E3 ubiquitin-protein ligase TRIM33-like [Polistes dominula]
MEGKSNEQINLPEVIIKTEPLDQNNVQSDVQQSQIQPVCAEKECEQRIECTTEFQDTETRAFLSKCIFCEKTFTIGDDPKLLECLHASCTTCVNNKIADQNTSADVDVLLESNVIVCQICNVTSQVENLIENRFISKIIEEDNTGTDDESIETEEEKKCTSCHDNAIATSWCVECEEFICQSCVMAHQRLKITKDHTIKPKEEVANDRDNIKKGIKKVPTYLFCTIHSHEQLSLFCQTCDRLTCRDCQLSDHRDHKYKFIHEIAAETKSCVSTLLKEVSYKRVLLRSAMKVIEDRQILIVEKKKTLVQEITQMVVQLTNAINTRGKLLVMRLNEVCDQKQNTLNEKKVALDQLSKLTDHCIQFVSHALSKGTDMELLYSKKSVTSHLQRIKSRRADIPNPEIPVRIHLSFDKVPDLIKVVSSIGAIVVDGRVYPSISPSAGSSSQSVPLHEPQSEQKQTNISINTPVDNSVIAVPLPIVTQQPNNTQQNSYQQIPVHLTTQQQPQQQVPSPNYMQQHFPAHNMPRLSPQIQHTYNNKLQQPLMMPQRPLSGCHQQVTSSTHPHQQVHLETLGQNTSLRGLLAHNPPPFRPAINTVPYRILPYRYPPGASQRPMPPNSYQPTNTPVVSGIRLQQCNPTTPSTQHVNYGSIQQPVARWHIPQNICLPFYGGARHQSTSLMTVPANETYKITLKNQQSNNQKYSNINVTTNSDMPSQSPNTVSVGHAVSSSVPKTPSPVPPGKTDETEKSLDKFCQKSLNDLMLTIAKLDSNGIVVIPEAQKNSVTSIQVDSSTDEGLNAMVVENSSDNPKNTTASMVKDDPNEDWCAVCMDGGDAVLCCDKCPKVFHLYCHIPSLKSFPDESETWQCMLCTNILDCSDDPPGEKKANSMSAKELRIAQRVVLELYCQYEQSLPFREIVSSEITEYHRIIKKPIALDVIRDKLKPDHPNHYTDLRQVMTDIRLMFKNAFIYNPVESQVYQEARNLEEFFEKLLLKWAPNYAYDDPFLSANREEDEEVFPPNKKYRRIITD